MSVAIAVIALFVIICVLVVASFYNPDDRGNNNLYKKVVKAYNKLMSNMKDIFEEIEDENY